MHELTVVQGIMEVLERRRRERGFRKIRGVELVCGPYNCLAEDSLQFWFDVLSSTESTRGARLHVERLRTIFRCSHCRQEWDEHPEIQACPDCRAVVHKIVPDNDIFIRQLEVE